MSTNERTARDRIAGWRLPQTIFTRLAAVATRHSVPGRMLVETALDAALRRVESLSTKDDARGALTMAAGE